MPNKSKLFGVVYNQSLSSEKDVLKEIRTLCNGYLQYPYGFKGPAKVKALFELSLIQDTKYIPVFLKGKSTIDYDLTNSEVIEQGSTPWRFWFILFVLITATLPISVPVLMVDSWSTRGTLNFLKTDGSIFLDRILELCQLSEGFSVLTADVNTGKQDAIQIERHPDGSYVVEQNSRYDKLESKTELKSIKEIREELSILNQQLEAHYEEQKRQQEQFHHDSTDEIRPKAFVPTTNYEAPIIQENINCDAANQRITPMLTTRNDQQTPQNAYLTPARITPAKKSIINEGQAGGFVQLNSIFAQGSTAFFSSMVDKNLERHTGTPVITSYRINSPVSGMDLLSMDIKCKFRYTSQPSKRINIQLVNTLEIPLDYQIDIEQGDDVPQIKDQANLLKQLWSLGTSFFSSTETFADLLEQAAKAHGIDSQVPIYLRACELAKNPVERTQVLEGIINAYGNYYNYCEDKLIRSGYREVIYQDLLMPQALSKLDEYKKKLPSNFRSIAPSALDLKAQFQAIWNLLQTKEIDAAWELYKCLPKLTHFIKHTFPNLEAMEHQLSVVFILSRHKMYYGPGTENFIPEHCIIGEAHSLLNKALHLVALYKPDQSEAIKANAITPLNHLIQEGQEAEKKTSNTERKSIYEAGIKAAIPLRKLMIDATYRIPNEDMDADEEPRVVVETSSHLNSRK